MPTPLLAEDEGVGFGVWGLGFRLYILWFASEENYVLGVRD